MRDDLQFNINFVELIESKPCLYDYNRQDYCNRNVQDVAWNEISKRVDATISDCKERWKNIRGSFTKYLNKKVPSGSSAKQTKPYYLAENLRFLQPFTKSRKPLGNTETQDNSTANEKVSSESDSEIVDADSRSSEYAEKTSSSALHIQKKKKETQKYPSLREVNTSAFEYFQKKQKKLEESSVTNTEDPDKAFMISVLPDMRKMTDDQKRKFKIGILKLAGEILEGNQSSGSSVRQMFSPQPTQNSSVESPSPTENIFRSYHSLEEPHLVTNSEYVISFPTQQPQQHSFQ